MLVQNNIWARKLLTSYGSPTNRFKVTRFSLMVVPLNDTTYIQRSLGIFGEWLCTSLELSGSYLQTKQTSPTNVTTYSKNKKKEKKGISEEEYIQFDSTASVHFNTWFNIVRPNLRKPSFTIIKYYSTAKIESIWKASRLFYEKQFPDFCPFSAC